MKTVRATVAGGVLSGAVLGLIAQIAVLTVLEGAVGLTGPGWIIGVTFGVTTNGLLARTLHRSGAVALGPANSVTLARATLVGGVTALVAGSFDHPAPVPLMVALATAALLLDTVDGAVARRTRTVSPVGARFDMEVDAFLVLMLSVYDVRLIGAWVLAIGAARYVFVAAGWVLPWLRASGVPPRYWNKVVAAIQGIVLTTVMADVLPRWVSAGAVVVAMGLLAESFGREVWWLWRHRPVHIAAADHSGSGRVRRTASAATTVLAGFLVWFALVAPTDSSRLEISTFLRIPIEGLVVLALVLVLPARPGRILVILSGAVLGVLTIIRLLDMGFLASLNRPFSPLSDWSYIGPAIRVLGDSIGQFGAIVSVIAAAALIVAVAVLVPLSARRLTRLAARDRPATSRFVAAFGAVWLISAVIGLQLGPGAPIASAGVAQLAYEEVSAIRSGIEDQQAFESAIADDPVGHTPPTELLAALRGKDVLIAFVESYGRIAVQDSDVSPGVDAVLDAGTRRLSAAGFSAESAFLTSPTFGGISWLAHSTLQSGLRVDSQRRYDQLLATDRLTLSSAFGRAGWRTVLDSPANDEPWPEGTDFYRYEQVYDSLNVGYRGPDFGFAAIPDQYTLSAFQRAELADPGHAPVMAEFDLLSSHTPWAPLPSTVPWSSIGDGSGYAGMPDKVPSVDEVWGDTDRIRSAYGRSIEYTLESLISFVETYGDPDLVLLVVGDHQPATIVSGANAGHDVPVTLIAHDPAVLDRIGSWGWQAGMNPAPEAPVWPMESFRDRFLDAFGS
jgi:phosphatidylglycerophosphate synthase